MGAALVVILKMPVALLLTTGNFVFKEVLVVRLLISGILFSIFVAFILGAAVVTKPVTLGILFSVSVVFVS